MQTGQRVSEAASLNGTGDGAAAVAAEPALPFAGDRLLDAIACGVLVRDADGRIVAANAAAQQLLGCSLAVMQSAPPGRPPWEAIDEDGHVLPYDEHPLATVLRTGESLQEGVIGVRHAGGEIRWLQGEVHPLPGTAGRPGGAIASFIDVTARIEAERRLKESEARFRALSEHASDALVVLAQDQCVRFVSGSARRISGYLPDELIGQRLGQFLHPEDRERVSAGLHALAPGEFFTAETRFLRKDGRYRVLGIVIQNLRHDPAIGGFVINARDITERREAEEALHRQNNYLAALHETALAVVNRLDVPELLEAILSRAAALLGAEHGFVDLVEPGTETMRVTAASGLFKAGLGSHIRRGEGVAGKVWVGGAPLFVAEYADLADGIPRLRPLVHALAGVPLTSGGEVVGVLGLAFTEPERRFGEAEVDLLLRFAQLASLALDNARLFSAAQQELAERERSERALQASEQRYRDLFENASDVVYTYDLDGNFTSVNRTGLDLFGYTLDEVLRLNVRDLLPPAEAADALARTERRLAGELLGDNVHMVLCKDGRRIPLETRARLMYENGVPVGQQGVGRDISRRLQAEELLRRQNGYLSALHEVTLALLHRRDVNGVLETISATAGRLLDTEHHLVYLVDAERGRLVSAVRAGRFAGGVQETMRRGEGIAGAVWQSGEPLVVDDYQAWAGHVGGFSWIRAAAGVPLRSGGRLLGVLGVAQCEPGRTFSPDQIAVLEQFGELAAIALENARLYTGLEERLRRLQTLTALNQLVSSSLDMAEVLREIARATVRLIDVPFASFWIADEAGATLRMAAYSDDELGSDLPERTLRAGQGAAGWILQQRRPLNIPDVVGDARVAGPQWWQRHGLQSFYGVPVMLDGRVLAVLALVSRQPFRPSDDDLQLIESFTAQAAVAIRNASLYQALAASAAQQAAARAELAGIIAHLGDGLLLCDPAGTVTMLNPAAAALLALGAAEAKPGASEPAYFRYVSREGQPLPAAELPLARALAGRREPARELVVAIAGEPRVLSVSAAPLAHDDQPGPSGAVALLRDVTDVRRAQERVAASERFRALGEMASGVAHDFNNLLAIILGRAELLAALTRPPQGDPRLGAHVSVIQQAARDGEHTVKRLQAVSGLTRRPAGGQMDVAAVLEDVVAFTRPRWKDRAQQQGQTIAVQIEAEPLPPLVGEAAELREVLINLVFNAVDALPHGGTITLRSRRMGDEVLIEVRDTGIGMTEAVRRRVFDPFFSTKGAAGTGLGLSVSYGIIARMGGRMAVVSAPNQGTTVSVALPCQPAAPEPAPAAAAAAGPARILLVDDEPLVRQTAAALLELDGHLVVEAESGAEALRRLAAGERFAALLTDLGMPAMSGMQLVAAVRARGWSLPCVLVTGWGSELGDADLAAAGVQAVLNKPFSREQLREVLGGVLRPVVG